MRVQTIAFIVTIIGINGFFWIGNAFANHCISYDPSQDTINVLCGSARLSDVDGQLVNRSILMQESKGIWLLNANLVIANSATLYMNTTDVSWLKINSATPMTAHNIEIFGNLIVDSIKITSWNSTSDNYGQSDGKVPRSSITVLSNSTGRTEIKGSDIGYFGYSSPYREGISFQGAQAILQNNTIHHMWYGIALAGDSKTKVYGNHFYGNTKDISNSSRATNSNHLSSRDLTRPLLAIITPTFNATIPSNLVLVEGMAFDPDTGVKKVEVVSQKYPTVNASFDYQLARPVRPGNWSSWSIPLSFTSFGPHRILAMATDKNGNENWAEVTVNILDTVTSRSEQTGRKIAFVQPSFTEGAYNVGGFYTFYPKYNSTPNGVKVTTDLSNLTAIIPEYLSDEKYYKPLARSIKDFGPQNSISVIRDEDVHNGYIFRPDGTNAYDVLFLLHDEYVTQQGYDNFRTFVKNGGTIVFLDGNMFYAQVSYNKNMHTVKLDRGHDWQFDGKAAVKSAHERYFKENKEWIGSNFLYGDISAPVRFENNPFNYTHFEENYVNNPNATILLDYNARIPDHLYNDNKMTGPAKIATYQLNYGKGKVIVISLYSQELVNNNNFLKFFGQIILPRALGQPYKLTIGGNGSAAYWWMNSGKVTKVQTDLSTSAVNLTLARSKQIDDNLLITLPKNLVGGDNPDVYNYTVLIDNKGVTYNQTFDDVEAGFAIPLSPTATNIQISLTANVEIPEGPSRPTNTEFFKPSILIIPKGTSVVWTNEDAEAHTVTSRQAETQANDFTQFDSLSLATGRSFKHMFNDRGIFDYHCTLHPFMMGKVIVK